MGTPLGGQIAHVSSSRITLSVEFTLVWRNEPMLLRGLELLKSFRPFCFTCKTIFIKTYTLYIFPVVVVITASKYYCLCNTLSIQWTLWDSLLKYNVNKTRLNWKLEVYVNLVLSQIYYLSSIDPTNVSLKNWIFSINYLH